MLLLVEQINSLRERIGVVPQSPILFDDTIMNNVRYGRITATDEEVHEACRAACIHDKIEGFTNGMALCLLFHSLVTDYFIQGIRHGLESEACTSLFLC